MACPNASRQHRQGVPGKARCVVPWMVRRALPERIYSLGPASPQALPSFIEHESNRISESDLHMASYHLARYIKAHGQGYGSTTW